MDAPPGGGKNTERGKAPQSPPCVGGCGVFGAQLGMDSPWMKPPRSLERTSPPMTVFL